MRDPEGRRARRSRELRVAHCHRPRKTSSGAPRTVVRGPALPRAPHAHLTVRPQRALRGPEPFPTAPRDGAHYDHRRRPAHRKTHQKKIIPVNFSLNPCNELGELSTALPLPACENSSVPRATTCFSPPEMPATRASLRFLGRFQACKQRPWNPIDPKSVQKKPVCNTSPSVSPGHVLPFPAKSQSKGPNSCFSSQKTLQARKIPAETGRPLTADGTPKPGEKVPHAPEP